MQRVRTWWGIQVLRLKRPFWFSDLCGREGPEEGGVGVAEEVAKVCGGFLAHE